MSNVALENFIRRRQAIEVELNDLCNLRDRVHTAGNSYLTINGLSIGTSCYSPSKAIYAAIEAEITEVKAIYAAIEAEITEVIEAKKRELAQHDARITIRSDN